MDPRYEHLELAVIFDPQRTAQRWLQVEEAVARAQALHGLVPTAYKEALEGIWGPSAEEIRQRELVTRHDVAAFVQLIEERLPEEYRRWVHFGMTSSDLVDTANALALKRAGRALRELATELSGNLRRKAPEQLRMARTHGREAEPTLVSSQFLRMSDRVHRARARLADANVPMKLSGPVGTYPINDRKIEVLVASQLTVPLGDPSGQIVARDYYAAWAYAVVDLAGACERIATEIRLSAQSGVDEIYEAFEEGQIGSSSMPHKRNPIRSERICALARVARGYLHPILETVDAMWGERDISNSSVERVALRDLAVLVGWMLEETTDLVKGLVFNLPDLADRPSASEQLAEAIREGEGRSAAHARLAQEGRK